jgi:VCBS repeat-containing protein
MFRYSLAQRRSFASACSKKARLLVRRRLSAERLEDRQLLAVLFAHDADDPVRAIAPSEPTYNNLGLDWTGSSEPFDDSAWTITSGATNGVGYDRGNNYDALIGLDLESTMHAARTTMFVRAEFDVADLAIVDRLTLNLRYDDGFIAWLNGVEVARANADGVYPAWAATATSDHQASTTAFDVYDLTGAIDSLRQGTNVLAIRGLNVSASDDDALVQFTLTGEQREGPPLAIDDTATTDEGVPIVVDVLVNDEEGAGTINPASVAIASPPTHGTAVANSDGTITYTPNAIYNGPDTFTYTVRDDVGMGEPRTEMLVASTAPAKAIVPTSDALGTTWRGEDEEFDDSGWQSGTLGVGFEQSAGYEQYIGLNVGPAMYSFNSSVYVRTTFSVDNPANVSNMTLRMRYDDGFAAFINGVLVASANSSGDLVFNSSATGDHPDSEATQFQSFDVSAFISELRSGTNVLAIHGLNVTTNSSDMLVQPELVATIHPRGQVSNAATVTVNVTGIDYAPIARDDAYTVMEGETLEASAMTGGTETQTLIRSGATWRFRDNGQLPANDAQQNNWKQTAYDDAAWSSGPARLGYGDPGIATTVSFGPNSSNKHITTWFRHTFNVDAQVASRADSLLVELSRDDGAAIYLNGVEIVRDNLPGEIDDATVTPTTLAPIAVDGAGETTFYPFTIDLTSPRLVGILREGANTLAVEVHQTAAVSSDLAFDLRLITEIALDGGVLGNDTEPDGQTMTAVLETPPANGVLDLAADGTFSYTPNVGFVGVDTFTYRASDGALASDPATVSITVTHGPPTAMPDSYTTDEDTPLVIDVASGVLANDLDSLGHALTASVVTPPAHGVLSLATNGSFTYTPNADYSGSDSFTYRASDGASTSATVAVSLTVTPVNDAPMAVNDVYAVLENQTLNVAVSGFPVPTIGDFDAVQTPYTLTQHLAGPGPIVRSGGPTGNFVRLTQANNSGLINSIAFDRTAAGGWRTVEVEFDYRMATGSTPNGDGMGMALLNTAHHGTTGPAPEFPAEEPNIVGSFGIGFDNYSNFTETDNNVSLHFNDQLIDWWDISGNGLDPNNGMFHHARAVFQFGDTGTIVTLTLTPNGGAPFTPINAVFVPGARAYESRVAFAGRTGQYTTTADVDNVRVEYDGATPIVPPPSSAEQLGVLANDMDPDRDTLSSEIVTGPSHGTLAFNDDGTFSYTPEIDFIGVDSFTYQTWDGQAYSAAATVTIDVLHAAPTANPDSYTTDENTLLFVGAAQGLLANDVDTQGHALTASVTTPPANGTLTLGADGSFTYTPAANFNGTDSFTYRASDGELESPPAMVQITVESINTAPVAVDDVYRVLEGQTLYAGGDWGEPITLLPGMFQWSTAQGGNGHVYQRISGTRNWHDARRDAESRTLGATAGHLATITSAAERSFLTVLGESGHWLGGFQDTQSPLYVEPAGGWKWITAEPWAYTSWHGGEPNNTGEEHLAGGGSHNWNDLPGAVTLDEYWVEFPVNEPIRYDALVSPGATWRYRDDGADLGTTWRAPEFNDSAWASGPAQLGYGEGDEATITFGGAPAARFATTYFRHEFNVEDIDHIQALTLDVLRDDGIAVYLNGTQILRNNLAASAAYNQFASGSASDDGQVWQPFAGIDPALLQLGVNTIAVEVHANGTSDTDLSFDLRLTAMREYNPPVLDNDIDVDGVPPGIAMLVSGPSNGVLTFSENGVFSYRPNDGFFGVDTFTYQASDGALFSEPATVTIHVIHPAPTAGNDSYATNEDTLLDVSAAMGLLANDSDTQGHSLAITIVTPPAHGTLNISPEGSFTYTPEPDYFGADSFTYTATDGDDDSDVATVTIDIAAVNDAPVAVDDFYTVPQNDVLSTAESTGGSSYSDVILASNPIAYWRFGEPSGATTTAETVSGLSGTLVGGATLGTSGALTGDRNSAITLNGSSGYVAVPPIAAVNQLTGNFTIEAWVRPSHLNGVGQIFSNRAVDPYAGIGLWRDGGRIGFTRWSVGGQETAESVLLAGEWTHVVVTFDNEGWTTFYINGIERGRNRSSGLAKVSTQPIYFGRHVDNATDLEFWAGDIDEVSIYSRVFAATEASSHYRAGSGIFETRVVNRGSTWLYRDNITNGSAYPVDANGDRWNELDYDDTAWPEGGAMLGYGEIVAGPIATTIGYGGNASDKYRTALFRRAFSVDSAERVTSLVVDGLFDDGASIYINGTEVLRYNLPGTLGDGALGTDTLTQIAGDESVYQTFTIDLAAFPGVLVDGLNMVAVEVHQTDPFSSDLGFDMSLTANVLPDPQAAGVLGNDTDVEDDDLSAELLSAPQHGVVEFNTDGTFVYTPAAGYHGEDSFTYRTFDGAAYSAPATVRIVVTRRLVGVDDAYSIAEDGLLVVPKSQGLLANDPGSGDAAIRAVLGAAPANGTLWFTASGAFHYQPNANFSGTDTFTYRTTDGIISSEPATVTIAVAAVNDAPRAINDAYAIEMGETLNTEAFGYANAVLSSEPLAYWRLGETSGTTAVDSSGNHDGTYVGTYSLGQRGAIARDPDTALDVDGNVGYVSITDAATFGLGNNFTISAWIQADQTGGLRRIVSNRATTTGGYGFGINSGTLWFTTYGRQDYNTTAAIDPGRWYHVAVVFDSANRAMFYRDGVLVQTVEGTAPAAPSDQGLTIGRQPIAGTSGFETFDGRIDEVVFHNRALTATEMQEQYASAFPEETAFTLVSRNATWRYLDAIANGSPYPTDAQGDSWREMDFDDAAWASGPGILGYGGIEAGPTLTTIRRALGGDPTSLTALFRRTFEVEGADRAIALTIEGVFDDGAAIFINGREVLRYNLPGALGDGSLTTDTWASQTGDESRYFTFAIDLAPFPDLLVEGTNTIAVEVHQVNTTSSDLGFDLALSAILLADPAAGGVLGNDIDAEGDAMTASLVAGPYHGTLEFAADGTFIYTPDAGFEGVDQFTYRANDGAANSVETLVTINVGNANGAPLAADDRFVARHGVALTIAANAGLLANDFDANGDPLTTIVFAQPTRGLLTLAADGSFVYTPQAGFVGVDSFTYRVADDSGTFGFATATIHVATKVDPINGIPIAAGDAFAATLGTPLSVAAPGVLANDQDPERRSLAAVLDRAPWHGSLSFDADGSFTYTPRAGFSGQDSFTYRASDGNTFSTPSTVTIQVASPAPSGGIVLPVPPGSTAPGSTTPGTTTPGTLPISGDLNGDGRVDRADLAVVMAAYGSVSGMAEFMAAADMNGDGRVSMLDAIAVRNRMGSLLGEASTAGAIVQRVGARSSESVQVTGRLPAAPRGSLHSAGVDATLGDTTAATRVQRPDRSFRPSSASILPTTDRVFAEEASSASTLIARRVQTERRVER